MRVKKKNKITRFGDKIDPLDVLPLITNVEKTKETFNEQLVGVHSTRLQLFKEKGITCVFCGITGLFFAIEKYNLGDTYHLNLYGIDKDGEEVLMTKDHIVPKSKGGSDSLVNLQTACLPCNQKKGSLHPKNKFKHIYQFEL